MEDAKLERSQRIESLGYDYSQKEKMPMRACNLCGSTRWVIISHVDRYGYDISATSCSNCGQTMLNPCMTVAEYSGFYKDVYRPLVSAYHGRLIDAKTVQAEQHPYANQMVKLVSPFIKNGYSTMLDVGGSTGLISTYFAKEFRLKCTVIDPAPDEIAEAKEVGIEAITGFVEEWDGGGKIFDVIAMFQTIDHLLDIKVTLTKLRNLIHPEGLFIVDIVDFRAAILRNHSVEEAIKIDHVYSLTQEVMEAYLTTCGFAWVTKSFSQDHLHVLYLCQPTEPVPGVIPEAHVTKEFFRELRYVQNSRKCL